MLIKGFSALKEGEYQGYKYANYIVYGVDEKGNWTHEKVGKQVFNEAGMYDVNALIGNDVQFLFNRFGKIVQVRIAG